MNETRTPILIGESGASVFRIQRSDGCCLIEKQDSALNIRIEAAVMNWCAGRLPVARIIQQRTGSLVMIEIPGVTLTEVSSRIAVSVLVEALNRIHALPAEGCPFSANWTLRVSQAEQRLYAGLVNESDFDEENLRRDPAGVLSELKSLPPLPDVSCFTHGDACLENFLSQDRRLSGIVDWGRAGITHPAQDWALALRSVRSQFGPDGERMLRGHLPIHSASEVLLRRFRLLDEFF
jgi:kanamycin kinase/aminoglycoside 3'-phosphotransferase-2